MEKTDLPVRFRLPPPTPLLLGDYTSSTRPLLIFAAQDARVLISKENRWKSIAAGCKSTFASDAGVNSDSGLAAWLGILDLVENPGAGKRPVVFYCGHRNPQGLGGFLVRHAYEITQFDYLGLNRMILSEIVQHFMHCQ